ncbi:MAG: hypothetical protein HGB04_00935 [Chlorobiaceae bacterium]|nr:hypothetical protein [Chlorobiaceae bacterium]
MRRRPDTIRRFRYLLLFSGLFNILLASPLMIPGVADRYLFFLSDLNASLHLGGLPYVRPLNPAHSLLINTAGIDLVLIGSLVLYAALDPDRRKGIVLLNMIGRLLFAAAVGWYVLTAALMPLVLAPALVDVVISIGFIRFLVLLGRRGEGS